MARAILLRGAEAGIIAPSATCIAEPEAPKREAFAAMGFLTFENAAAAARAADGLGPSRAMWLLAVKPQVFASVAGELASAQLDANERTTVSIMAGLTTERICAALACEPSTVVRTMPNLGATVGRGVTAIAEDSGANPESVSAAGRLMRSLGSLVEPMPEAMIDAFTAVAGSGPAYVFYLAEAMTEAAQRLGFEGPAADRIVRGTIEGAAELLTQSARTPEELRASVTSRGGTTAAALESLERDGVREAVARAIGAAAARSRELAG